MTSKTCLFAIVGLVITLVHVAPGQATTTEVTKWQYGKTAAVSLTYDDGSINQFRVAVPIMDSFNFPATFFIITGEIPGSRYQGTFIGRPKKRSFKRRLTYRPTQATFLNAHQRSGFSTTKGHRSTTLKPARRMTRETVPKAPRRPTRSSTRRTRRYARAPSNRKPRAIMEIPAR